MYARLKRIAARTLSLAGAGALLWGLGIPEAAAQKFEYTYGGPSCVEAGRGGVQPVRRGGYIAVGETFSPSECETSDIYLVRTNNDGSRAWTKSYDIGGNDSATDVQEVFNDPTGTNGFIITGVTENLYSPECRPSRDVFLLRVDHCGRVLWTRTYGHDRTDEIGWDVVEAQTGSPALGTNPGDFIVAGSTTYTIDCRSRNGYLLRMNHQGGLIWDVTYDGPNRLDDYFYALDESLVGLSTSTGDIIVAGGSNSYFTNSYDAWIVRVNGDNGQFTGPRHTAAAYGRGGFDELRSIQELRYSCNERFRGHLVATGRTSTGLFLSATDVYVLQTEADPCQFVNNRSLGISATRPDEGYCIREIPFDAAELRKGDLVVTGFLTTSSATGHGGRDMFLRTYLPGTLAPATTHALLFGGDRTDWGWSVSPVAADECRTAGLIVAGFTNSTQLIDPFDPQQLYLVKSDLSCERSCTAIRYKPSERTPQMERMCQLPILDRIGMECRREPEVQCQYWQKLICLDMENIPFCPVEQCECGG